MSLELTTATDQQLSGIRQTLKTVSLIGDESISGVKIFEGDGVSDGDPIKSKILINPIGLYNFDFPTTYNVPTISGYPLLDLRGGYGNSNAYIQIFDGVIYAYSPDYLKIEGAPVAINDQSIYGVGIGTDNPSEKLHVVGNIKASNNIYANNLVYITGNQTIDGQKTFNSLIYFSGGANINMLSGADGRGGSIDLSNNNAANFSIQTGNLPTQNDGSIYNKINDSLYLRKNSVWEKVITNKDNPIYATGDQNISGLKTFNSEFFTSMWDDDEVILSNPAVQIKNSLKIASYDTSNYFDQPKIILSDAGLLKSTGPKAGLEYRSITLGVNIIDDLNGADIRKIYSGQNAPIVSLNAGPASYSARDGILISNNKSATFNNQNDYILFIDTDTGSNTYGGVKIGGLDNSNIRKNVTNPIAPGFLLDVNGNIKANNLIYNTGDQTISGVKTFNSGLSTTYISGVSGSSLNILGCSDSISAQTLRNINITAGSGTSTIDAGDIILIGGNLSGFAPSILKTGASITIGGAKTSSYTADITIKPSIDQNGAAGNIVIQAGATPTYNGKINMFGDININGTNDMGSPLSSKNINIYRRGDLLGFPSQRLAISIDNNNVNFQNEMGLQVSGVQVTPSLYVRTIGDQSISGAKTFFSGLNIANGTLNLNNSYLSGENIKPSTGISLYNRSTTARNILTQVDSEGRSLAFQPNLATNRIINFQSRSNSTSSTNAGFGINLATSGILARPVYMKVGDVLGSLPRIGFQHTGGLNEAGVTNNVDQNIFRGTGGLGGFFFQARFGISENNISTSGRGFFGLWDKQTVLVTNSTFDPYSSNRQNLIGVGFNSGDSNLSFIHSDSTSPGTDNVNRKKISLGSNFPIRSGNVYELSIYGLPDKSYVDMNISILRSGISTGYRATTALPAADYALAPNFSVNGPIASGNIAFDLSNFYIDTQ